MRASTSRPSRTLSKDLNRLISAAVVSPRFQTLLLSDAAAAITAGYNGEKFQLTPAEYTAVTSLRVSTVRDFAVQLLNILQDSSAESAPEDKADSHRVETHHVEAPMQGALVQEVASSHSRTATPPRHARYNVVTNSGYLSSQSPHQFGA